MKAMSVHVAFGFLATITLLAVSSIANAGERRALVIGTDTYANIVDLERANADATAVSDALGDLGFSVTLRTDLTEQEFLGVLTEFSLSIQSGDDVVFFFAGHGISVGGENYLLPSDIPQPRDINEAVILRESIPVELILDSVLDRGAGSAILILDACRDNPYGGLVGEGSGLARMATPDRSFVFKSASEGQTALDRLSDDDPDPNSVFTRVLLQELQNGDRRVEELAQIVVDRVRALASGIGHEQVPIYEPRLASAFRFTQADFGTDGPNDEEDNQLPGCGDFATALPLHALDSEFFDLSGQGDHISFGGAATVCIANDQIQITAGQQRSIPCEDVLNGTHDGLGHTFFSAGKMWRFWFYIPQDGSPRTLQMGLYEGSSGDDPLYWIETGVAVCNG